MCDTRALSIDIVISESFGNLLDDSTFMLFAAAMRAGWVSRVAAGPPCETWSVAREIYYKELYGPRRVRDAFHLSGYNVLKIKELRQVIIGNQLLGVALRLFLVAWIYNVFYVLEHPGAGVAQQCFYLAYTMCPMAAAGTTWCHETFTAPRAVWSFVSEADTLDVCPCWSGDYSVRSSSSARRRTIYAAGFFNWSVGGWFAPDSTLEGLPPSVLSSYCFDMVEPCHT